MCVVDWGSKSVATGDSAHEVVGNEAADDDGAVKAEVDVRGEETSWWRMQWECKMRITHIARIMKCIGGDESDVRKVEKSSSVRQIRLKIKYSETEHSGRRNHSNRRIVIGWGMFISSFDSANDHSVVVPLRTTFNGSLASRA